MKRDELILYEVSRWRCILGRQIKILAEFDGQRACGRRIKKLIDNGYLGQYRIIIISQLWLIFSIAVSKPLIIGSDYDCELFPCTEKYHLKPVLLNYAVLP